VVEDRSRTSQARPADPHRCPCARRLLPCLRAMRMAAESLAKMQANDPVMNGMIIKTKYGNDEFKDLPLK